MITTMDIALPEGARVVAGSLASAGYDTLIVGGAVRDTMLERPFSEVDLLTSATVDDIRDLLQRLPWVHAQWESGVRFGTVGARALDTSVEITVLDPESGPDLETRFAANAAHRDFTVNAMGVTLPDSLLLDPLGGRSDLRAKILRAPGTPAARFAEDPIRIVRMARLAATLGFSIEANTFADATKLVHEIERVAPERVHAEMWRLLPAPYAGEGIRILRAIGALKLLVPEADPTDERVARMDRLPAEAERRFAALLPPDANGDIRDRCAALRCSRAQARAVGYFLRNGLEADPAAPPVSPLGGNAIISELGVAPGPLVGQVKSALTRAVADGMLEPDDREGALRLARSVLGISSPAQEVADEKD